MSNGSTKSKCAQCAKEIPADQESLRMPIRDSVLVVCSWSCFRVLASKVQAGLLYLYKFSLLQALRPFSLRSTPDTILASSLR